VQSWQKIISSLVFFSPPPTSLSSSFSPPLMTPPPPTTMHDLPYTAKNDSNNRLPQAKQGYATSSFCLSPFSIWPLQDFSCNDQLISMVVESGQQPRGHRLDQA